MKLLITLTLLSSFTVFADHHTNHTKEDPEKAAMMKKMMEYSTPGDPHKVLEKLAGKWNYTSTFWETAESKPQISKGVSILKMILGGRFLQQEFKGVAMGMPFQGLGLTGYDNIKKQYDGIWIDSMGTGIMKSTGTFDEKTQTLSDKGTFTCPAAPNNVAESRSEWKIIDRNNSVFSMYGKGMENKAEFKMMEIVYKRSK